MNETKTAPAPMAAIIVAGATLLLYILTLPRAITLEDAGLFQMVCHNGGIGHPPGYPLFTLVCQQFVALPFFPEGVFAGNLLSAVFASATAVTVMLIANRLLHDSPLAMMVGVAFGLSNTFWSQAIVIEVYSLAAFLFFLCFYLALRFSESGERQWLLILALVYGLALANHWPLQLLSSLALLPLLLSRWPDLWRLLHRPGFMFALILLLAIGLSPYLILFSSEPAFSIYGPIEKAEEFARYVARSAYSDHSDLAGWSDRLSYQIWLLSQSAREFGLVFSWLIALGVFRSFYLLRISASISLLLLYLASTAFLNVLLGFEYNEFRRAIFSPYPVIAYGALAIWLGIGLHGLLVLLAGQGNWSRLALPLTVAIGVAVQNLPPNYQADNQFSEIYARNVLKLVPEASILFVEGDNGIGLIGYLHYVKGIRPDLELRSWNNLVFPNRLMSPFAAQAAQKKARDTYIAAATRPVYSTSHGEAAENMGLVFRHNAGPGFRCDGQLHEYYASLIEIDAQQLLRNGHERDLLFQILLVAAQQHVGLLLSVPELDDAEIAMLNALQTTLPGKLALLQMLSLQPHQTVDSRADKAWLNELGDAAAAQLPKDAPFKRKGLLAAYQGRVSLMTPPTLDAARAHLERSIALYPKPDNPGACLLVDTYRQMRLNASAEQLIKRLSLEGCG